MPATAAAVTAAATESGLVPLDDDQPLQPLPESLVRDAEGRAEAEEVVCAAEEVVCASEVVCAAEEVSCAAAMSVVADAAAEGDREDV